jgi:hypothetical protein
MIATTQLESTCHVCGVPADSSYFDDSSIAAAPQSGGEVVLARFELHPNYCGVLQYFAQYTNAYAASPVEVETPDLEWQIRSDGRPLAPWLTFGRIINPWGLLGFPIHVRLQEGSLTELVVRNVAPEIEIEIRRAEPAGRVVSRDIPITKVGGRLLGRYWYNTAFGGR